MTKMDSVQSCPKTGPNQSSDPLVFLALTVLDTFGHGSIGHVWARLHTAHCIPRVGFQWNSKYCEELRRITKAPVGVQEAPVGVPEAPVGVPEASVGVREAPADVPETPVDVPKAPVGVPEAPVGVPETPCGFPEAPCRCPRGLCGCPRGPLWVDAPVDVPEALCVFQRPLWVSQRFPSGARGPM